MSNSVFKDLEIDFSDMTTNPTAFSKRIFIEAEKLKDICKEDTSINALTRKFQEEASPASIEFTSLFNGIYEYADEAPLEMLPSIIDGARQLIKDLETMFKDRVVYEAATQSGSMKDKRLAQLYYIDLRTAYNKYVDFINQFTKHQLEKLPILPGNYGSQSTSLRHFVFEYKDEQYRNPRTLCRELGIEPISYYDKMIEYLDEHPELEVTVKSVM